MARERTRCFLHQLSEFAGSYPSIPLPDEMRSELGEDAMFVTLPIGKVGARSRNGRTYSREAVQAIVDAVNAQRPEGRWGHLRDDERATRYDPPAIRWLAAMMDGEGIAWAKGVPVTPDAREHFRIAKIAGARVGTSVYGFGQMEGDQVVDFELETIDLADPNRVGIPFTAARPVITSETRSDGDNDTDDDPARLDSENDSEGDMTIELNDVPEAVRQQIIEQYAQSQDVQRLSEMEARVSELEGQVQTLTTERDAARTEAGKLLVSYARAQIAEHVALEPVRKIVERMVGISEQGIDGVSTAEAVDQAIREALEDESVKELNKETFAEMMGPDWKPPAGKQKQNSSVLGGPIPH